MRASRLLSILILLQLRARLTADALAEEFEVSVRTIYRDIDELSAAGIPVFGDRGPGGGFQLLDGFRTRLTGLASDEAEAMLMIGLPGPAAELGLGPAASRASAKMLASIPHAWSEGAGRLASRFHFDALDWYRSSEPVKFLPALTRAVLDQNEITIRYESWKSTRTWELKPLGLVLKAGAWYLVAVGSSHAKTFKVTNISNLDVSPEKFIRDPKFELSSYWKESLDRFERDLRPLTASVALNEIGLKRLSELGTYAHVAVTNAQPTSRPGWKKVSLPFENYDQGARLLMSLGPVFEVESPDELLHHTINLAKDIAAKCSTALRKDKIHGKNRMSNRNERTAHVSVRRRT